MPVPVLLLGQGLTLLGTLRCLGRAGVSAYVLTGPDSLAQSSRWFRRWPSIELSPFAYDALPAVLSQLDVGRAVLVPCSDPWAAAVGNIGTLSDRFPSVVSAAETIAILTDKGRLAATLRTLDVPHPSTYVVSAPADLEAIPDSVLDAGFLKPRDSVAFFGRFKQKAFDFRGRAAAAELLSLAQAAGLEMMLQEYIPGPPDQHYFVDGLAGRDGGFTVLFARRRLRMYPRKFGNSSAMVSVPLGEVRDAVASLDALRHGVGLRGIFSAEFKRDARDGLAKLIEVNARPWWYIEFAATCGADVCVPACREALGLPTPEPEPYRVGVRLAYPYYDWPAWRTAGDGAGSLAGLLRFWAGATQPEWRVDDPGPAVVSTARLIRGWIRRRLRPGPRSTT